MQVREAIREDRHRYLRMVREFYDAGKFPFALDVARQNAIFDMSFDGGGKVRVWIAYERRQVVGYLLATSQVAGLSGELVAQENMIWVDPAHRRGGKAADSLMRAFLKWASAIGADRVNTSAQASMRPRATARFFRRYGLTETEIHFTRRL